MEVIASIAGIATAGAALAKGMYSLVSTARGASKEITDLARAVSDLSMVLRELRRVLKESIDIHSRRLLRRIKTAMKRISRIHEDIRVMLKGLEDFTSVKWLFKRSEAMHMLYQIESHKTGINMVLNILILALETKKASSLEQTQSPGDDAEEDSDVVRQQAENLACTAYESILSQVNAQNQGGDPDDWGTEPESDEGSTANSQLQLSRAQSHDSTQWLFDLVFLPYAQSGGESNNPQEQPGTLALSTRSTSHLQLATQIPIQAPGASFALVKELLADWTTLSEKEIDSIGKGRQNAQTSPTSTPNHAAEEEQQVIVLKDAVARKFTFPFERAKTWKGMKALVDSAFSQVDVLEPHVRARHYDLIGPDGCIVLPEVWEDLVQPGWVVGMMMWPLNEPEKSPQPGPLPTRKEPNARKKA